MPKVVVDPTQYEKFELASAPPDGFVELRPLPYGMKLARRSKSTRMMMRSRVGNTPQQARDAEQVFELDTEDEWAVAHDFTYCIGEHNLEDAEGNKLDFNKSIEQTKMLIKMLDPKVGAEIERLIDNLNNEEGEESLEDFLKRPSTSSKDTTDESDMAG